MLLFINPRINLYIINFFIMNVVVIFYFIMSAKYTTIIHILHNTANIYLS